MTDNPTLKAVIAYATERGWHVFPLKAGTKVSHKSEKHSGSKWGATSNPVEIARDFKRWPDAGVGLMCGAESGVFVLDIDTLESHHGVDGMGNLAKLIAENGPLPATLEAQSASGGRHFFFKWPTDGLDIKSRSGKIAAGIDVKATTGIVVLAPTRMAHGSYSWVNDLSIAPAPDWLLALARRDNHRGNGGDHPPIECPDGTPDTEVDLDEIAWAMTELPNETIEGAGSNEDDPRHFNHDDRFAILMALHRTFGGGPEGLRIFNAWSAKNLDKHFEYKIAKTWTHFNDKNPVRNYTAGTIIHYANRAAPGWRDRYHAEAARRIAADAEHADAVMMAEIKAFEAAQAAEGRIPEEAVVANTNGSAEAICSSPSDATTPPPTGAAQPCTTSTRSAAAAASAKATETAAAQASTSTTDNGTIADATAKQKKTKPRPPRSASLTALPQTLAEAGGGGGFDRDQIVNGVNRRHALVIAGNKAAVMKFEDGGKIFRLISVDAFKTWHLNRAITLPGDNGKPKRITHAELWLNDRDRREFEGIEFAPAGARKGYYNLWQGFAVEPRPGDFDCSKFLAHIRDNIAQGNTYLYNWVIGFFAQIVQQPHVKLGTALAIRGEPGVGKTKVGEVFGSLLKPHYKLVADPRFVTGQFNAHMASLLLLHADEAFWAGDRRSEGKLKDLVTGSEHFLEFKGVDPISVRNLIRLFVTGNSDWLVPAAFRERRWAVIDAGSACIQNHAYFNAIDEEMNNGGREALLHHLKTFDLKTVNLRAIPETKALLEQKFASATVEEKFWLDTLKSGRLPGALESEPSICRKEGLYEAYIRHARRTGASHRSIQVKVGMFLIDHIPGLITDQKVTHTYYNRLYERVSKQAPAYKFPALATCRQAFADKIKQAVDWGADVTDWQADERDEGGDF